MLPTISEYISRDLTERIRSHPHHQPPAVLTLPALSQHYGVSVTPVREALRALVKAGVLLKSENGRVRINPSTTPALKRMRPLPSLGSAPQTRSTALESALASEVIARSLRGDDRYLREDATAALFSVGRTAIRQAFSRLAGQGLIVHVPRCGWRVRPFDAVDLRAYLEVRETLELKALELARPHLVEADLRRMLAGNVPGSPAPRLDNNLHHYLVAKANNPYIREFFDRQGAYYTTLFDYAAPETRVVKTMARQHREILKALLDKDWKTAALALAQHIRGQRPIVENLLTRFGRAQAASPVLVKAL